MSKFKTVQVKAGGRLMTGLSSDTAGLANYTIKRDFRRILDKEVLAEGHDVFAPNALAPTQPETGGEAITLTTMARKQNNRTTVIAGTATRLWAYMLNDTTYAAADYAVSGYAADDTPNWVLIGSGFSAAGNRWEWVNINGYLVLNNGVDLPVTYRVGDAKVKPIYELREQGIAAVGTISALDGILICKDLKLIKESAFKDIVYPVSLGTVATTPTENPATLALSLVVNACKVAGVTRATDALAAAQSEADTAAASYASAITALERANVALAGVDIDGEVTSINAALAMRAGDIALQAAGVAALNAAASLKSSLTSASSNLQADARLSTSNVGIAKTSYEAAMAALDEAKAELNQAQALGDDPAGLGEAITANPSMLIGVRMMFDDGTLAEVTGVDSTGDAVILNRKLEIRGRCSMENPMAYAPVTDDAKLNHYQARVSWSMPSEPRRFGAIIPCTAYANSRWLVMDYPARSVLELVGKNFLVPNIGQGEGNVTITAQRVYGCRVLVGEVAGALDSLQAAAMSAAQALRDAASAAADASFKLDSADSNLDAARKALVNSVKAYPVKLDDVDAARAALATAQDDLDRVVAGASVNPTVDLKGTGLLDVLRLRMLDEALWQSRVDVYDPAYWSMVLGVNYPDSTTKTYYRDAKLATVTARENVTRQETLIASLTSALQQTISDIPALSEYNTGMNSAASQAAAAKAESAAADAAVSAGEAMLAAARSRVKAGIATDMMASDASGSITGLFEDIIDDGSRILKGMPLRGVLVIYKETSIFLMSYTGNMAAPFQFERLPIPPGTALHYKDTLVMVDGVAHFYAGRDKLYKFDLTSRVPTEFEALKVCKDTFFASVDPNDQGMVFAVDNPLTSELWFCFPQNEDGDSVLRYDYDQGTASTSACQVTAAGFVRRPEGGEGHEDWFIMGIDGGVMRYGLISTKPIRSGEVTANKAGVVVTSSAPFFTRRMVGNSIRFADGSVYAITGYMDSQNVVVLDPTPQSRPSDASVIPCGARGGGLPEVYQSEGDPNGKVWAKSPAICLDRITKVIWWKTDGKESNKGWH